MSQPTCYIHPGAIANTSCTKCEKPICAACNRGPVGNYCPQCFKGVKRIQRIGYIIAIIVFIIVFAYLFTILFA